MQSHILLINAGAVGSEALKNLVLPGVGKFTVLDDKIVNHEDLGVNFFVTTDQIGRKRAEVIIFLKSFQIFFRAKLILFKAVNQLLCEMNPDVAGYFRYDSVNPIIANGKTIMPLSSV